MAREYQLIVCIVNQGFSDEVIEASTRVGAKGGTIVSAHGSSNRQAEKLFDIAISPEKEIVLIVAKNEIVDDILKAVYEDVGLTTDGQGIAFTLPIDEAVMPQKQR